MSRCMIRPHPLVRARFWGFWMGSPPGSGGVRRWGRTGLRPLVHPVLVALALLPVEVVAQAPVVRDSAGVRIVENDSAALDGRTPWRNGEEPLLSIGVADGEPAYLFTAVNGATVLPDGAIAVADGAGHDVRLFDSVGAHVRTIGRQGQGPGEFSGRVGIVTYIEGDLLGVVSGARMLSVFRPTGEFVGSSHLRPEELHGQSGWQWPHGGVLRTGSPVVWTGESPWQRPISGAWRRPERLDLLDSSGEHVRKIADFPGIETSVDQLEGGGYTQQGVPLYRSAHVSAVGDRVALAVSDTYGIRIFDESGDLIQIVKLRRDPRPTDRYLERWMDSRAERLDGQRRARFRAAFAAMPVPEHVPEMEAILLSRDGYLWVREYRMPWEEDDPAVWHVFDPGGVLQARLTTPANFRLLEIGPDYLLGVSTDDLGIERVQLRALERR